MAWCNDVSRPGQRAKALCNSVKLFETVGWVQAGSGSLRLPRGEMLMLMMIDEDGTEDEIGTKEVYVCGKDMKERREGTKGKVM